MRNMDNLRLNIKELVLLKSKPVDYIEDLLLKSYSHKPYLAQMPYDRNTRNPYKMCARYIALEEYEKDLKDEIDDLNMKFSYSLNYHSKCKKKLVEANEEYEELDENVRKEKEELSEFALDRLFLDGGVAMYDNAMEQFDDDDWTVPENSPSYQYFEKEWVTPLEEVLSFTEKTGYCDKKHSDQIDAYIERLESLDIPERSELWSGWVRRETGIEYLRQIQSNKTFDDAQNKVNDAENELINAKKDMSSIKRRNHERNVALYEVANEKLNCSDVFDDAKLKGNNKNPLPTIEEYIDMSDIKQSLNKDGTVKEDFLDAQRQVALDNGDPWYE